MQSRLDTMISDNLIYNRFDIIGPECFKAFSLNIGSECFDFQYYCEGNKAYLNVWGKEFPQEVFEDAVGRVFENEKQVDKIEVRSSGNQYHKMLDEDSDVVLELNHGTASLDDRIKAKGRYNIRREMSRLEEDYGKTDIETESSPISDETINLYFAWKEKTHGRDYQLTPREYVEKYHVTDVLKLVAGTGCVSMVLFCKVEDTVYVENLSYDPHFSKYSPGTLAYYSFLQKMEKEGINYVFLGHSGLDYKLRFGSMEYTRFSGIIYRPEVFERINDYFRKNDIHNYAVYGLGFGAKKFWAVKDMIDAEILFGVDRNECSFNDLQVISPSELSETSRPDIVIITLLTRDRNLEKDLESAGLRYIYHVDLLDKIGKNSGGNTEV